jgi:hypothetical protein
MVERFSKPWIYCIDLVRICLAACGRNQKKYCDGEDNPKQDIRNHLLTFPADENAVLLRDILLWDFDQLAQLG